MKTNIKNWLEKHEFICGIGLLIAGLGAVAFGGAYLGANAALSNAEVNVTTTLIGPDGEVHQI